MLSMEKAINGLKIAKVATNRPVPKNIDTWQKNSLPSITRMCSGKTSVSKDKDVENTNVGQQIHPHLLHQEKLVQLKKHDKWVLYWFSHKKYKSFSEIPSPIKYSERKRAYDMQRIVGCSVLMVLMVIGTWVGIRYQKKLIRESEYHGERYETFTVGLGHDVGQPRPSLQRREKEQ